MKRNVPWAVFALTPLLLILAYVGAMDLGAEVWLAANAKQSKLISLIYQYSWLAVGIIAVMQMIASIVLVATNSSLKLWQKFLWGIAILTLGGPAVVAIYWWKNSDR